MSAFLRYIWQKKRIILLIVLIVYVLSFLLLPIRIELFFGWKAVDEREAVSLLPIVYWKTNFVEEIYGTAIEATTFNILAVVRYMKWHKQAPYDDKNKVGLIIFKQSYPYNFHIYLYQPFWWLLGNSIGEDFPLIIE